MLDRIHVMGAYWRDDHDSRTPLGELIAAAKDHNSESALIKLQQQLSDFASEIESAETGPAGDAARNMLVVPVPVGPGGNRRLVSALAVAVATAMGATLSEVLTRRNATTRLRDTPPQRRLAVVEAAGYEITSAVVGRSVVLVDDVVLTGTTLRYIARLLQDAGATSVVAVVAARTRRADEVRPSAGIGVSRRE